MSSPVSRLRSRRVTRRSRRQRFAAGAVLATTSLLGTYLAAIRPQPTYAAPMTPGGFGRGLVSPMNSGLCAIADDTTVYDDTSLRTAVAQSDDDSVICIGASFTLSDQVVIDDTTITLIGRDDSAVTLAGSGTTRHFFIENADASDDDTVTIANLSLINGVAQDGDGTNNFGGSIRAHNSNTRTDALILDGVAFDSNTALLSSGNGGAASVDGFGLLRITDSRFTSNQAQQNGGAIWVRDTPLTDVSGSTFTGNNVVGNGGAIHAGSGTPNLKISDSTFIQNESTNPNGRGGVIYLAGFADVQASTFSANEAGLSGGAIHAIKTAVSNSTFDDGHLNSPVGKGGAIYTSILESDESVFSDNYGYRGGAAYVRNVATVDSSAFLRNDSYGAGAGLFVAGLTGQMTSISSTTFLDNGDTYAPRSGGAIVKNSGELEVSNSTFYGNRARDYGGALALYSPSGRDDTITYTTIVGNRLTSSATRGAGIDFYSSGGLGVTVANSILYDNQASGGAVRDFIEHLTPTGRAILSNNVVTSASSTNVVSASSEYGDPSLGAPGDNGGPRVGDDTTTYLPTMLPAGTSTAIGAASPSFAFGITTDQIGATRTSKTAGAITVAANPPPPPPPTYPPSAPLDVVVTAGDREATFGWKAPNSAGSFPVTNYRVTMTPGGHTCLVPAGETTCTISGLENGTTYTATVQALNGAGWGATATSGPVTPRPSATRPGPVQDLTVVEVTAAGTIELTWQPPLDDGGSPVTSYRVRYRQVGTEDYIRIRPNTPDTTITVTGLIPGQRYWVRVAARNDIGHGPGTRTNPRIRIPTS